MCPPRPGKVSPCCPWLAPALRWVGGGTRPWPGSGQGVLSGGTGSCSPGQRLFLPLLSGWKQKGLEEWGGPGYPTPLGEGLEGAERAGRQVHPEGGRCLHPASLLAPRDGAGIQAGTWRPWHTALPSRVLRPQQDSVLPVRLSRRALLTLTPLAAVVARSCPPCPWAWEVGRDPGRSPGPPAITAQDLGSEGNA